MAGQRYGRYEILRPLGTGGMGEVLLARQSALPGIERLVVIKKVLPHLARDPGFLQRFLDETRVAASLSHGNIVAVHEVGELDGEYFMAMEYVEGMDLREVLHRLKATGRTMPEDLALYVLIEVANGLSYAHEKRGPDGTPLGIVHRDVSPANLLLSSDGQVKLTDFGVAKAAMRLAATLPGTLQGKVYYMSPEQVQGRDCDSRSDIFSLGVVGYEMLAGVRPFDGDSDLLVMERIRRCEPPPLCEVAPQVPPSLAARIHRALALDPNERYPTMEAFRVDLTTYLLEAHTLVSARALADFLSDLRERGTREADRPGVRPPSASLDEVAMSLLDDSHGGPEAPPATRTRTVQASLPLRAPARRRAPVWWMAGGLVALAVASALLWPRGQPDPTEQLPVTEGADIPSLDERGDPGTVDDRTDMPGEVPEEIEGENPEPPDVRVATTPQRVSPSGETPSRRAIRIQSHPARAEVWEGDRMIGHTPLEVPSPASPLRLEIRAEGFRPHALAISPGARSVAPVRLAPASGRLRFRFFPANARVELDGRTLAPQGNVVDLEVAAGVHRLVLTGPDGMGSRVLDVEVPGGGVKALGTLELANPADSAFPPKEGP